MPKTIENFCTLPEAMMSQVRCTLILSRLIMSMYECPDPCTLRKLLAFWPVSLSLLCAILNRQVDPKTYTLRDMSIVMVWRLFIRNALDPAN